MATKKKVTKTSTLTKAKKDDKALLYVVFAVIAIIVLAVVVTVMQQNETQTMQSQAAPNVKVSEGDDIFSLEQDLNVLGANTANQEIYNFSSIK